MLDVAMVLILASAFGLCGLFVAWCGTVAQEAEGDRT